jgi:transposase
MNDFLFDIQPYNTAKEDKQQVSGRKRIRRADREQYEFKTECIDDLIAQDHRARDVWEYVSSMNLDCFHDEIRVTEYSPGPGTLDPKIAMSLWLFAALNGIVSARELERLCQEHHAYIWICGGASVNHHTLSDFKRSNPQKFMSVLQGSIAIMWKTGAFHPDEITQDGTRIKANAGSSSFKREETLEDYLLKAESLIKRLEEELKANPAAYSLRQKAAKERSARERKERIEKAKSELSEYKKTRTEAGKRSHHSLSTEEESKMKISITDPECRKMKMGTGGFRPAYNVQFATSTKGRVVVGVEVVNTQDPGTMVPMIKQVCKNLASIGCPMPSKWIADGIYANKSDVNLTAEYFKDIDLYAPPMGNQYVDGLSERKGDSPAMSKLRKRMSTKEGKEIYNKRCSTAEFTNAVVKNRGMFETLTRGLNKVTNMALIYAVMHNMMRFWSTN